MTITQTRLLNVARNHAFSRGRWPAVTDERFHYAAGIATAVTLYALRPGYGYCVAWISGAHEGCLFYDDEADAIARTDRAVRDMKAGKP